MDVTNKLGDNKSQSQIPKGREKHLALIKQQLGLTDAEIVRLKEDLQRDETIKNKKKDAVKTGKRGSSPEVVVFKRGAKRKKETVAEDSSESEDSVTGADFDLERARFEVKKFGIKGLDKDSRQRAETEHAVKLGAKAPTPGKHKLHEGEKKCFVRGNKNRPQEVSSKIPTKILRERGVAKKGVHRDPRFDDLSGEYSETFFGKAYGFLSDIKQREREKLEKKVKKVNNEDEKQNMQRLLQRMEQQKNTERQIEAQRQQRQERKQQERSLVKDGKRPYFLKKSEQRQLELAEKFRQLKKSGKLDNYMQKKRKKNASKDRRMLPKKQ